MSMQRMSLVIAAVGLAMSLGVSAAQAQSVGSENALAEFLSKAGLTDGDVQKLVNHVLGTDHGLGDRPGIQKKFEKLGKKKFTETEFDALYAAFAKRVLSAAGTKLGSAKTRYKLSDDDFQKAFDAAADDIDGQNPRKFLDGAAKALRDNMKTRPRPGPKEALGLARAMKASFDAKFIEQRHGVGAGAQGIGPGGSSNGVTPPAGGSQQGPGRQ